MSQTTINADRPRPRLARFVPWLSQSLPTALVLAALGGLGYWGHQTGWKLPKFSALAGNGSSEAHDWCAEHNVPESQCIACNAKLMPNGPSHGWCGQHGVHECPLCHPEVAQLKQVPKVLAADIERTARSLALKPRPTNNGRCRLHLRRVQFPTVAAVEKAGIDADLVQRGAIEETLSANGEVRYDQTRVARLSTRTPGTVWRVEKKVGDWVGRGDVLALVDAAAVGQAKAELLRAAVRRDLCRYDRQRLSNMEGVVGGHKLQQAESALREAEVALLEARQALVNLGLPLPAELEQGVSQEHLARAVRLLGLPEPIARSLDPERTTANLIPVTAPIDGRVAACEVVAGEVVDPSKALFTVVDTRRMWLVLDVTQEDVRFVSLGQPVRFRADGSPAETTGCVAWISTSVDPQTRTVEIRAELPNPDGQLRDEAFGMGKIVIRREPDAVVVASEAIHWDGCCHVAFVRDKDFLKDGAYKVFHARSVRPGATNGRFTEVIAGLLPGEVVATAGSGALRAELLKGNLGAGCLCGQ